MQIDAADHQHQPGQPAPPTPAASDDAGAAFSGDRRHRPHLGRWVAVTLAVVLAALGAAYYKITDDAADQVVLRWRNSSPDCGDAKVRPAKDDSFGEMQPATIVATEGLRCTIVVEVLNNSERTIHLDHAIAPFGGPRTGSVVRVDPRSHPQAGHESELGSTNFGIDAYIAISTPGGFALDANDSTTFSVDLTFNPQGCVAGGRMWMDTWPEVHFSVLGRDFARTAANALAISHRGRTPGCDDHGD